MEQRDLFDGLLVAVLGGILYVRLLAPGIDWQRARTVLGVVTAFDIWVYLLLGGVVTVLALTYMFVYLPQKQSRKPAQ
jgi:hypothetical protein